MKKSAASSKSESFVYGAHTVEAVVRYQSHRGKKLFVARKKDDAELIKLAERAGIKVELLEATDLKNKFGVSSDAQGVVLTCTPFPYYELEDVLGSDAKKILILDSWQDAANIGRAARASLCFGVDAIIMMKDRAAQINAAAEKAAVGALAQIKVVRVVNLSAALSKIKEQGFFVYGADEHGETTIKDCQFANKSAIVIGQEGAGLRELTKKRCDALVSIPMSAKNICLNAADTALLFLYELNENG